ncbi:Hint domain-containing protein [Pseudoruegeria sp. SHC-113]|uniref:Hint domain-containing protein n=1 Tax=Pseudoruegeria sp. SHC-113 TaxID=2855439 RepID=UPI0021BB8F23|nr:Hint domain-containing protein [Pseudoruegeria sp. SHC-113]MCT8161995.1 Hint domain-containing protein [Pseudoruegeria sp. SHC-113]
MRRYDVACLGIPLDDMPSLHRFSRVAPASPHLDAAFAAFAHGTLLATPEGPRAIEDLEPGDKVDTLHNGPQPLRWIGRITLPPAQTASPVALPLLRILPGAFGGVLPERDMLLGPYARILRGQGDFATLRPVAGLCDDMTVVQTASASAVSLYHIGFARHEIVMAGGLPMESFHPGENFEVSYTSEELSSLLDFFPASASPRRFGRTACKQMRFAH